jgi:AcrR family transcriptional regulator
MRSQAIAPSQPKPRRARGREKTAKDLKQALESLQARSARVSIAAVAREAGVSAPLIHNKYPDFAEQLRGLVGKTSRQGQTRLREMLKAERKKSSDLRTTIKDLTLEIIALASENESLRRALELQVAVVAGKVVRISS